MMVVAAAAFAMAAGGAYLGFRSPASDTSVVHASAPAATPSQPAAATSTPPATPTVTTTQLALPGGAGAGKTAPPAPSSASPSARREEESSPAPLSLREPTDVSVRDVRQEVASVAPPTLTMGAAASPSLPNLPSTMPEVQPRVSGGITEAKLIHRVDPPYPDVARQMHIEGNVEIRAVVAHDGQIKNPVAVSGPPMLRAAALDAVRKWRYEPSKLDGQPTDRDLLITISFHLPR
jgi:protein TonB